jgi:6-phosphogluconolactonase
MTILTSTIARVKASCGRNVTVTRQIGIVFLDRAVCGKLDAKEGHWTTVSLRHGLSTTLSAGLAGSRTRRIERNKMSEQREMSGTLLLYVGTYSRRGSEGIYLYRFDLQTGGLHLVSTAGEAENPSFLAIDPRGRYLYAVNEVAEFRGQRSGAVSAFAIEAGSGGLTFLNHQPSGGPGPCHLTVDRTGRFVLVANYSGGSASILPIGDGGALGEPLQVIQHYGSSVHPRRQEGPHAHSVTLDPQNRYAFVADLGMDKIMIYRFDATRGTLEPGEPPWVTTEPGAGPRHFAFHPSGEYAYVINELDSTLTAFTYDGGGTLRSTQTVSTLPQRFEDTSYCADVHVSPSGRFVYGSNRGHDSIAIFQVDEGTGKLKALEHEPTQGENPRNFVIAPSGNFVLVANQDGDNVVVFRVDQETGSLSPMGQSVQVPAPVCLTFAPRTG